MIEVLNEAKDLKVYTKLIRTMGDYVDKFPATSVSRMFRNILDKGMKVIPKDKFALDILNTTLYMAPSPSAAVTKLLNQRFADLDISCGRPTYKNGNATEVAFWSKDGMVSDKILSLLNVEDGGKGFWSDAEGNKVTITKFRDK